MNILDELGAKIAKAVGMLLSDLAKLLKKDAVDVLFEIEKEIVRHELPGLENEPINWGDLDVVDAAICVDRDGKLYGTVWIEEVDPGAANFERIVKAKLEERGWIGVQVNLSW